MIDKNGNIKPIQQKKLSAIGSRLQQIRVEKNISLETISQKTFISARLLRAIEAGNLEELPELFYTKALIRKFAGAIDAQDLIDLQDLSEVPQDINTNTKIANNRWYLPSWQIKPSYIYGLYILAIIASVKGITVLVERPVIINKIEVAKQIPLESPVTINRSPSEESKTLVSQSTSPQSAVVNVNLKDRCWLKVIVDGKVEFEGTLPKGTNRTWTGREQVTIRAGNAGGVFIAFNNEQEKLLGEPGQVEEITYRVN